jgi:phage shock protein E
MNWKAYIKIPLLLIAMILSSLSFAEAVWIDVRSSFEHAIDNIDGDPLISHEEIIPGVNELFPDKSTEIHLYCRSGQRAGVAMHALKETGYTNVSNEGGINDARKKRGLVQ